MFQLDIATSIMLYEVVDLFFRFDGFLLLVISIVPYPDEQQSENDRHEDNEYDFIAR